MYIYIYIYKIYTRVCLIVIRIRCFIHQICRFPLRRMHQRRYIPSLCIFLQHLNIWMIARLPTIFLPFAWMERNWYRWGYRYIVGIYLVWNFNLPRIFVFLSLPPSESCMKFLNYFPTMKFNFSYALNDSFDRLDKFVKFLISVDEKNMNGNYLNPIQDISMKLHGDSVLFDDISYAHFVCNLKVIQLEVVRRARIPDGFMGKPFYLLPLPDKRCNSISKDYLVPSKVLCTLYQLQIYLGKFCSSFMNRARILKLPSCGPRPHKFFPRTFNTLLPRQFIHRFLIDVTVFFLPPPIPLSS